MKLIDAIQNKINNLNSEIKELEDKSRKFQSEFINIDGEIKNKIIKIKEDEKIYDNLKIDENLKDKVQQGINEEEKIKSIKNNCYEG